MNRVLLTGLALGALLLSNVQPAVTQGTVLLEEGIRLYTQEGNVREAIRRLGDGLDSGVITGLDGVRAHVYMAHAFLALGDSLSAVSHIQSALAAEPCLVPSPDLTPPPWQALYDRYRPQGASCGRQMPLVALKSLVIPGWGQYGIGNASAARYFFVGTALTAGGAFLFHRRAESAYSDYQATTDINEVTDLFDRAQVSRRLAMVLGGTAAGVYLWNVIDAAIAGSAHDRSLSRVRPIALQPLVEPSVDGIRLGFRMNTGFVR